MFLMFSGGPIKYLRCVVERCLCFNLVYICFLLVLCLLCTPPLFLCRRDRFLVGVEEFVEKGL